MVRFQQKCKGHTASKKFLLFLTVTRYKWRHMRARHKHNGTRARTLDTKATIFAGIVDNGGLDDQVVHVEATAVIAQMG